MADVGVTRLLQTIVGLTHLPLRAEGLCRLLESFDSRWRLPQGIDAGHGTGKCPVEFYGKAQHWYLKWLVMAIVLRCPSERDGYAFCALAKSSNYQKVKLKGCKSRIYEKRMAQSNIFYLQFQLPMVACHSAHHHRHHHPNYIFEIVKTIENHRKTMGKWRFTLW